MNLFMKTQIMNMISTTKTFQQTVKLSAIEDDGQIDKAEKKMMDEINKATEEYRRKLEKIIR